MFFASFIGLILFSILIFLNFIRILEIIYSNKNITNQKVSEKYNIIRKKIHNQKILGCVWIVGFFFSLLLLILSIS